MFKIGYEAEDLAAEGALVARDFNSYATAGRNTWWINVADDTRVAHGGI